MKTIIKYIHIKQKMNINVYRIFNTEYYILLNTDIILNTK